MVNLTEKKTIETREFVIAAAKIAVELISKDITAMDLKGKSPATDYFMIATGTSPRQIRTVADKVCEFAKKNGHPIFGKAGYQQGRWILLDFVDVVVHVFDDDYRDYYDLELLWGDAKKLEIEKACE